MTVTTTLTKQHSNNSNDSNNNINKKPAATTTLNFHAYNFDRECLYWCTHDVNFVVHAVWWMKKVWVSLEVVVCFTHQKYHILITVGFINWFAAMFIRSWLVGCNGLSGMKMFKCVKILYLQVNNLRFCSSPFKGTWWNCIWCI